MFEHCPPVINLAGAPHVSFQLDGLPIGRDFKHLPVVGLAALITMGQHVRGHHSDVCSGMPGQDAVSQSVGTPFILLSNGRYQIAAFSTDWQLCLLGVPCTWHGSLDLAVGDIWVCLVHPENPHDMHRPAAVLIYDRA